MLPSRNPDFPDALVRRPKDLSKGKAASARKNAAAAEAEAEAEAGASEGAAAGEAGVDADQGGEESGTPVGTKKAVKGKPKARKSVLADPVIEAGLEKTLAEQSAKVSTFSPAKYHMQTVLILGEYRQSCWVIRSR